MSKEGDNFATGRCKFTFCSYLSNINWRFFLKKKKKTKEQKRQNNKTKDLAIANKVINFLGSKATESWP